MVELNKVYKEDCIKFINGLEDKSIDLVVTDPPYWHHKSPGKPYSERKMCNTHSAFSNSELYNVDGEMMHNYSDFTDKDIYEVCDALKPKMKIYNAYFFCSESQVPYYCMYAEEHKLMFSILVWRKPVSIINKNRFSQNLEYIVRIYNYGTALNRLDNNSLYDRVSDDKPVSGKQKLHPTQKPLEIFEKFILLSSKEGGVVLDPFCGSGTCADACIRNNRNFIGCEIDEKYYNIANDRITNLLNAYKND